MISSGMDTDPNFERELAEIAHPQPTEIEAERRLDAAERGSQIWFLFAGFVCLFGFAIFLLVTS